MIFHVVVLSRAILYFHHGSLATWTFEFDVFARESIYPWDTAFPGPLLCQFQTVTSWQRSRSDVAELFIEVGVKGGCRSDQQSAGSLAIKLLWIYMNIHDNICSFSVCGVFTFLSTVVSHFAGQEQSSWYSLDTCVSFWHVSYFHMFVCFLSWLF
jgi:hypothetical protein